MRIDSTQEERGGDVTSEVTRREMKANRPAFSCFDVDFSPGEHTTRFALVRRFCVAKLWILGNTRASKGIKAEQDKTSS